MYGLISTPILGWTSGTLFGAIAGNILPAIAVSALGIAIYAMFIAIVVPVACFDKKTGLCALLSVALSCLFYFTPVLNTVPSGFVIVICAVLASVVFAILFPIPDEEAESDV
jgi:predicted branched-subunit amino acid permease